MGFSEKKTNCLDCPVSKYTEDRYKEGRTDALDEFVEKLEHSNIKIGRETLRDILFIIRELKSEPVN